MLPESYKKVTWELEPLKSLTTWAFVEQFVQADNKENKSKPRIAGPLWKDRTVPDWFPSQMECNAAPNELHVMMSSLFTY